MVRRAPRSFEAEAFPITLARLLSTRAALVVLVVAWVVLAATRIIGPSDLYDKEQPRTTSYTADMLLNGHWFLQYDATGGGATKPPLYNWISAPFVAAFGFQEWALRIPSLLASVGAIAMIMLFARWIQARAGPAWAVSSPDQASSAARHGIDLAPLAVLLWLANAMTNKLLYVARPDMLLTALLCAAWFSATVLVTSSTPRRGVALAYWLCTAGAALAKGPMALLPLAYLPLAAILLHGEFPPGKPGGRWPAPGPAVVESWRQVRWVWQRSGAWWGVPLMALPCLTWGYLAWRQEPEFFRSVFLGQEITERAAGPQAFLKTFFNGPFYMLSRFFPWSLGVLVMLGLIPPRRWFKHPLAPAIIWIFLIFFIYSFATTKRPDRYFPVYPAIALMAAWCLVDVGRRCAARWTRAGSAAVALVISVMIGGLGVYNLFFSEAALTGWGTHVAQFASAARERIGNDRVFFMDCAWTPLQTLMGYAQHGAPSPELQRTAQWVIHAYAPGTPAVLVSASIHEVDGPIDRLGLYRLKPGAGVQVYKDAQANLMPQTQAAASPATMSQGTRP